MITKCPAVRPGQKGDILLLKKNITQNENIFNIVKLIPFPDVQQAFDGQETCQSKILCPFHNEQTPSLHVYEDGYYCFGCGERGDSINFVAKLEDLKPLEAAFLIAGRFDLPVDRAPTAEEQRRLNVQKRNRNIAKLYKQIEDKAFLNLANFKSLTMAIMETEKLEIPDELVPAVHLLPQVEYFMQILISGTADERLQLLREGVLLKWAKMT